MKDLLAQCTTDAERFAVGLAYYGGLLTEPDSVVVFPGLVRARKVGTNTSDTLYFLRNEAFEFLHPLWHRRWSNPGNAILRAAKLAGAKWRSAR